jgi:transaldolase
MPPNTLEALLDHGVVKPDTVHDDVAGAKATVEQLAAKGISLHDVTEQLVAEGVKSFAKSFEEMLVAIADKQKELAAKLPVNVKGT